MMEDFGAFTMLSSSPPSGRSLAVLLHHAHRPAGPSRSASTLSPVAEGNEDAPDGRASAGGRASPDAADPVQVISTSMPPSRTFLELTRGGFFNADSSEEEGTSGNQHKEEGVDIPTKTSKLNGTGNEDFRNDSNDGKTVPKSGLSDGNDINSNRTAAVNNNHHIGRSKNGNVELKRLGPSAKAGTAGEDGPGSPVIAEARSPRLSRPRMANSGTLQGSTGGGNGAAAGDAKPLLPALAQRQSVEQAVHRDRVNALMRPANSKPSLGKLSRKSAPTGQPSSDGQPKPSRPPSPPCSSAKNSPRSARARKLGSAVISRPNSLKTGTQTSPGSPISPTKSQGPPVFSQSGKGVGEASNATTKQQQPEQVGSPARPRRRKSLPEIQAPHPPVAGRDPPATPPVLTSPNPRRPPPRRKISEPCFPTQGSLASLTGGQAGDREQRARPGSLPGSLPSSPTASSVEAPLTPARRPPPPRRKISEPCFPTYGSPVAGHPGGSTYHQQPQQPALRGIFADPRYNPVLLGSSSQQAGSCPDLHRRPGPEARRHAGQQNLASLSALSNKPRETEPRPSQPSFTEEYEKLKNCRYLRKSNGDDDM